MDVLKTGLSLMENTKSVQPLNAVGKRLEENSNPVWVRKWFDGSLHARNQGCTMAGGCAEVSGFAHCTKCQFCTVCPDTNKLSVGQKRS